MKNYSLSPALPEGGERKRRRKIVQSIEKTK
jgi:hypothetical protein